MACQLKDDPEVTKAFWNEAKRHLAEGVEPEEAISRIAKTYGIGTDVVGGLLSKSKQLFQLTNEAWAKQAKVHELTSAAKRAVAVADKNPIVRGLSTAYESTRKLLTVGHGGVIPFTHARNSLFIPGEAKIFGDTVAKAYSYMTPNAGSARWRADMATLRSDSMFKFAARVGLDVKLQSAPSGMGMSRWTRMSFDAIKPMRLELFKKYWKQLPTDARTFEGAKDLAKRINHATGVVNTPPIVSKIASKTMFAPKLRFAKYASALSDPFASTFAAKRFAKLAAVNLGLLAVNDMVNRNVFKNGDKVNWTDPSRADWLRLKVAGMTIPLAPMFETARLVPRVLKTVLDPKVRDKWSVVGREVASAAHPTISAAYGALTGKDLAMGKTLPFQGVSQRVYGDQRKHDKDRSINVGEYAAGFGPIPTQPILKEMAKEGVPPDLSEKFVHAYVESVLSGMAGTHAYPTTQPRTKH